MVKHGTRIFAVEILWIRLSKSFRVFRAMLQRIYATILSEIDRGPCQIVYHMYSQGNPRPPCGKSWPRIITVVPVGRQSGLEDTTVPQY